MVWSRISCFGVMTVLGCSGDITSNGDTEENPLVATLTWDHSLTDVLGAAETLGGFNVYVGASPRPGNTLADLAASTPTDVNMPGGCTSSGTPLSMSCTYAMSGFATGSTYYFSVTAYDLAGNESDPAPENPSKSF